MGYKFTVEEKKLQKFISVIISKEEVVRIYHQEVQRFKNNVNIPGFRKGKVNDKIIINRFGDELRERVEKALVQNSWKKFIHENPKEKPLGTPEVQDKGRLQERAEYTFTFFYESSPDFEIPSFDEVDLCVEDEGFQEEKVDLYLKEVQMRQAQFEISEEAIAADDIVELSYIITLKEKKKNELSESAKKFLKSDNQAVYLMDHPLIPEAEKELLGHKKGEQVSWDFSFPKKFYFEDLSEKKASISCKVLSVKSAELPQLDDEFARKNGAEGIEMLKKSIRDEMYSVYENQLKSQKRQVLLDHILKEVNFPLPANLLKSEEERYFSYLKEKDKKEKNPKTEVALKKEAVKEVSKNLKQTFVIQKLISEAKVSVESEELDRELLHISYYHKIPIEKIKKDEKYKNLILNTYNNLLQNKALDSFVDKYKFQINNPK